MLRVGVGWGTEEASGRRKGGEKETVSNVTEGRRRREEEIHPLVSAVSSS